MEGLSIVQVICITFSVCQEEFPVSMSKAGLTSKRPSGLMVSALVSGSSGPGSSPGQGHCVVFFSKTRYSHSACL